MPKTKTTHTPGRTVSDKMQDGSYIVIDHCNNFVAKTYSMLEATRIAAAPDLLEALLHALPGLIGESEKLAKAAIHKARGES